MTIDLAEGRLLETGSLPLKHPGQWAGSYRMEVLGESALPQVMALQERVLKRLSRPDLLEPLPSPFRRRHLGEQGFSLGVTAGERLAAFRCVYFPGPGEKEWNLGIDLGLPAPALEGIANFQMICVHPAFRGHGLAARMNRQAVRVLKEWGGRRHLCATVSPYNYWNLRILLSCGFAIRRVKEKYGGKLRYIVHQDLHEAARFDGQGRLGVSLIDFESQRRLFAEGWAGVEIHDKSAYVAGWTRTQKLNLSDEYLRLHQLVFARPSA